MIHTHTQNTTHPDGTSIKHGVVDINIFTDLNNVGDNQHGVKRHLVRKETSFQELYYNENGGFPGNSHEWHVKFIKI